MKADIRWLDNPEIFRVNREDAHSDHAYYASYNDMEKKSDRWVMLLDGLWKFRYSKNAASRPADFYKEGYDDSNFDMIRVPGHIELQGYDKIPQWKEAVIDRAQSNYETFKNHTSILFWSLGNESYAGDDIEAMNQYFMDQNDGRLIHYEGVSVNRSYEDKISQVESRMYATPDEVRQYLDQNAKKPYVLCEYMHCMGNSLGGMDSYMNLLDKYPMFQGGFIWDYIDQAIYVKDEVTGEQVLRYGGDFDDRPSDYEFSGNGIVFADRTEKPATQEVKYYYAKYE